MRSIRLTSVYSLKLRGKSSNMALQRSFHDEITDFIKQFSFSSDFEKPEFHLVRYKRDDLRIDVWRSGTLGIYENGKQRFIKGLSINDMKEEIANL